MLEIRGHARGGQGMVTAFEIMAKILSAFGDFRVQAFPAFGVERTGAPIQAFLRAGRKEILNRSNIYHPNLVIVFDEGLLGQVPVMDGLQPGGAVLINTDRSPADFSEHAFPVYAIPATRISLLHGLGSRSLPIVNAAMIGALSRILHLDPQAMQEIIREYAPAKPEENAASAFQAFNMVARSEGGEETLRQQLWASPSLNGTEIPVSVAWEDQAPPEGVPDIPAWFKPLSVNKTGNWRVMTPVYADRTPPCNDRCPAGTDVRGFVKLATQHNFKEAYETILAHNPFPGVCGRVCPHFCEQHCNRNALDGSVNIGAVERFLADQARDSASEPVPIVFERQIAVIGAGPAGLTAALRLRQKGYPVKVFEALPQAGGMMRTGIPKFRLPDDVLDREIQRILDQGVALELNRKVQLRELATSYSAVITAVGSHVGMELGIQGNAEAVKEGIGFLREFKLNGRTAGVRRGETVAVVGGGNTAIDVSRTLLRLGAIPTIYYRRTLQEMPAIAQEVEEARTEGVRLELLTAPVGVGKTPEGKIELTLIRMELGEPDASGRRKPAPIAGSEYILEVDHLITAIGQRPDAYALSGSEFHIRQGLVGKNGDLPVFCAGDMAWGGTVAEAIGSGNKVAEEVHAYFQGLPYSHEEHLPNVVLPKDINLNYYLPVARHAAVVHHPKELYGDFTEVNQGLESGAILSETARCLHCGDCFSCGNCFNYCPDAAIHVDEEGRLRIDYDYCKGCGICLNECPCSAIQVEMAELAR